MIVPYPTDLTSPTVAAISLMTMAIVNTIVHVDVSPSVMMMANRSVCEFGNTNARQFWVSRLPSLLRSMPRIYGGISWFLTWIML
jgi:hypothetical protein